MTRILIAGATGLVGRYVLARALADHRVTYVAAPTRSPLPTHAKLVNPVLDPGDLNSDAHWWAVDGVVCTLGTTRARAGSEQAFRAVDFDLQLAIARITRAQGATRLALTSAMGANPHSRFFYMRTKGELEQAVTALGWPSLTIARPGLILGARAESRASEHMLGAILAVAGPLLPRLLRGNQAEVIGQVLLEAAIDAAHGTHVVDAAQLASSRVTHPGLT